MAHHPHHDEAAFCNAANENREKRNAAREKERRLEERKLKEALEEEVLGDLSTISWRTRTKESCMYIEWIK